MATLTIRRAIFLHCLPAHRGEVPTEQALIYALVTGDWDGSA